MRRVTAWLLATMGFIVAAGCGGNKAMIRGDADYAPLTLYSKPATAQHYGIPQHSTAAHLMASPTRPPVAFVQRGLVMMRESAVTRSPQNKTPGVPLPEDTFDSVELVSRQTALHRKENPPRILSGGDAKNFWVEYPVFPWRIRAYPNEINILSGTDWIPWESQDAETELEAAGAQAELTDGQKLKKTWIQRIRHRKGLYALKLPFGIIFLIYPGTGISLIAGPSLLAGNENELTPAFHLFSGYRLEFLRQSHVLYRGKTNQIPPGNYQGQDLKCLNGMEPGDAVVFAKSARTSSILGPMPTDVISVYSPYTAGVRESLAAEKARQAQLEAEKIARTKQLAEEARRNRREDRAGELVGDREISFQIRTTLTPFRSSLSDLSYHSDTKDLSFIHHDADLSFTPSSHNVLVMTCESDEFALRSQTILASRTMDQAMQSRTSFTPPLELQRISSEMKLKPGDDMKITNLFRTKKGDAATRLSTITLVEALPEPFSYIEGSATPPPSDITRCSDTGAETLVWEIPTSSFSSKGIAKVEYSIKMRQWP